MFKKIFPILVPLTKLLAPQTTLLSAVITFEGDECFRTDCGDLFLVPLRIVHRIGRNLANGEVLSGRVQQLAIPARPARGRKPIRRGPGKRIVEGKSFRLANEVRYIQRRAADHDSRILTIGQLVLFSTETGDAWLLDPADQLAARLARDGQSEPIHIEETDTTFAIGWKGRYRIDGPAFVYSDHDTGRVATIIGYPTDKLSEIA
jgi:hypothetical protein